MLIFPKQHYPNSYLYGSRSGWCHLPVIAAMTVRGLTVSIGMPNQAFIGVTLPDGHHQVFSSHVLGHWPTGHLLGRQINHYSQVQSAFLRMNIIDVADGWPANPVRLNLSWDAVPRSFPCFFIITSDKRELDVAIHSGLRTEYKKWHTSNLVCHSNLHSNRYLHRLHYTAPTVLIRTASSPLACLFGINLNAFWNQYHTGSSWPSYGYQKPETTKSVVGHTECPCSFPLGVQMLPCSIKNMQIAGARFI